MAFFRLAIISSLCCALLVVSEGLNEKQENADKSAIIQSALNYLNSNPNTVFNYRKGSLLRAENKGDILEVSIEVDVDCNNRYPDVSCNEQTLNCHAFMGRNPAAIYEVLSDVKCSPKIEITVDDFSDTKTIPFVSATPNIGNEKLDLSNEALPPGQGNADFVAIRKDNIPCLGCPFDLHTDAEGVGELIDTAVRHIESERNQRHKITNIRRLQQQVVAGIKYILLADVAATTCSKDADISAPCILDSCAQPLTCEVTFIQKPWIDKGKHIIKNNCTVSQEFEPVSHSRPGRDDLSNDILPHKDLDIASPDVQPKPLTPNYDAMAQNGNIEEPIDSDRLADIESQILFGGMFEEAPKKTKSDANLASPQFVQREPIPVTENFEHLNVEPLNSEQPSQLTTLYASMPAVEEINPIVVMYTPQNADNYLPDIRTTMGYFGGFNSYLPPRFVRELDSESSESDSKSSEEKVAEAKNTPTSEKTNEEKSSSVKPNLEPTTIEDVEVTTTLNTENIRKKRNVDSNSQSGETKEHDDNTSVGSKENDDTSTSGESKRIKRSNSSSDSSDSSDESEEKTRKHSKSSKSDSDDDDGNNCPKKKDDDSDSSGSKEHHRKHRKSEKSSKSVSDDESEESSRKHHKKKDSSSSSDSDEDSGSSGKHHKKHSQCSTAESDSNEDCSTKKKDHERSGEVVDNDCEKTKKSREIDDDNHCNNTIQQFDISTTAKPNKTEDDDDENNEITKEENGDSTARPARDDSCVRGVKSPKCNSSSSPTPEALRRKRSIGQLEKISPDEKVIVRDLADFAAATLDNIDDDHHKRVILQILGAKKLKLDGTYYQIILRLGISHCHENEYHENCREKLFTNQTKICKVQVHVEDDFSNPKVVKSQCQNIKKDADDRNRTNYSRYRRSLLVGGHSPIAANDSDVQKFLGATLKHLDSVSETPNRHTTVEVLSATSQVVAGARYIIKAKIGLLNCSEAKENQQESCQLLIDSEPEICTIDVWDRPWLNKTIYKVDCVDKKSTKTYSFGDKEEEEDHSRKKRGIKGGEKNLPESKLQEYLQKCLTHLDSTSAESNKYISEKVLKATTQVVAGSLVKISAQVTVSNCPKTSYSKDCVKLEGSSSILCTFEIWEKPWMNFMETTVKCEDRPKEVFRSKREIGGWERPEILESENTHKPNETKATIIVWKALEYLSTSTQPGKILRLMNLTHTHHFQAFDSEFWTIEAQVALCQQTVLMPSIHFTLTRCPAYPEHFKCQFVARKNSYTLLEYMKVNITCENDKESYVYDPIKKIEDEALGAMFTEFAVKYKKAYKDEAEYNFRLKIFRDNLNKIALLNKYEKGTGRYGFTGFADMSEKEFSKSHGLRPDLRNLNELPFAHAKIPEVKLPVEFDWREKGAVTEVKNQGLCGSCWAFSVTGNVEGQYAIANGKLLEFSEQELVDCDKVDEGCNGGLMDNAYRVIEKLGGLETESDYPYEGDDEKCHFDPAKVEVQLTGALNISHNETDMAKWLLQNGPISIAINANAMQFYVGGVSHPWKMLCNPNNLDHGVLIVGFGEHHYSLFNRTLPYWIVKNSWGSSWGEQGYYRVYRGDGTCGLNQTPSSAIVK